MPTPGTTSRIMAAVRGRDTVAEMALRRRLWHNGYRYRVHSPLPGHPDILFSRQKLAVFVDGDFWHGNSWRVRGLPSLEHQFPSRTNWWVAKISQNLARDERVTESLRQQGWEVLRFWESDVLSDPNRVARVVAEVVSGGPQTGFVSIELSALERRRLRSVVPKAPPRMDCSEPS